MDAAVPRPGQFGWIDLSTTDTDAAKTFYGELLGWKATDIPTPMGPVYSMMRRDAQLVAGIGPQPPDVAASGLPSTWNSYVIVDDADRMCAAAAAAGGFVAMPAMDVMTEGRMAMIGSPGGAILGVWQPRGLAGAELFRAPGSLAWSELLSRDLDADLPFYAEVFGWRWEADPGSPGYVLGYLGDEAGDVAVNCGAMATPPGVAFEAPSSWIVYLSVDDCEASFAQGLRLGAAAAFVPMAMGPGTGAGLIDPTGAMVCLGAFPQD
jgi:hypothetical protein